MTTYRVIVENDETVFEHSFDGEPQIDLTFMAGDIVYKVTTRAHDENTDERTIHVRVV